MPTSITLPDLTTYTDDDLDALRAAMDAETTRRVHLATIPTQVTALAAQYVQSGGDKTELTAAVAAG